jgi:hypothetical protein
MKHSEAQRILHRYCLALDGKAPSSNRVVAKVDNAAARQLSWWLQNPGSGPPADSPRSKAYLRAYLEIAGQRFFASGIPLNDGYMHPDRGVMKALLASGDVRLTDEPSPRFEVTSKGQLLLEG